MNEENTARASGETERELANEREDHVRAGLVTHDEARAILLRFNASHWRNHGKEIARYSIPADPRRDDDIRLGAYIARSERLDRALADLRATSAAVAEIATVYIGTDDGNPNTLAERTAMRASVDALHDLLVEIRRIAERGGQ